MRKLGSLVEVRRQPSLRRVLVALALAAFMLGGPLAGQAANAAGNQSCLSGDVCVSWVGAGSIYKGIASASHPNLSFFVFSNGVLVENNTGYGRTRNSSWARACFKDLFSYQGATTGNVPYAGVSWVLIGQNTSSYFSTNSLTC